LISTLSVVAAHIEVAADRHRPDPCRRAGRDAILPEWRDVKIIGLDGLVERRARSARSWDIEWKPERLSASFHGRDLFAPVAAVLARGEPPPGRPRKDGAHAMTGLRAVMLARDAKLVAGGRVLQRAGTSSDRPPGVAFWYENSNGLAEIAVNQGRADREFGLAIGTLVEIVE
jgi:S-adenosyl-L-methionine hydrolase (adenosine-forming)